MQYYVRTTRSQRTRRFRGTCPVLWTWVCCTYASNYPQFHAALRPAGLTSASCLLQAGHCHLGLTTTRFGVFMKHGHFTYTCNNNVRRLCQSKKRDYSLHNMLNICWQTLGSMCKVSGFEQFCIGNRLTTLSICRYDFVSGSLPVTFQRLPFVIDMWIWMALKSAFTLSIH